MDQATKGCVTHGHARMNLVVVRSRSDQTAPNFRSTPTVPKLRVGWVLWAHMGCARIGTQYNNLVYIYTMLHARPCTTADPSSVPLAHDVWSTVRSWECIVTALEQSQCCHCRCSTSLDIAVAGFQPGRSQILIRSWPDSAPITAGIQSNSCNVEHLPCGALTQSSGSALAWRRNLNYHDPIWIRGNRTVHANPWGSGIGL